MKINQWVLLGLAAAATVTIACGGGGSGGSGGSGNGGGNPGGSTSAPPGEASPARSAGGANQASSAPESTGTPQADFRGTSGSDRVDCAAIDTEFAVHPYHGQIAWTATALDRTDQGVWPLRGTVLSGVSLAPASGVLADGQSTLVHMSGSVVGLSEFAVVVSAPNSAGHGWVTITFHCG